MTILLTGDWTIFGRDEYFRKFDVYNMEWPSEVSLETQTLTSAPYGGPIAIVRDRKKVVKIQGGSKPVISIYNAAGVFVSSFLWDSGHIVQMGWSSGCDLLCVREDGQVLFYDMFANWKHKFSMGQEAQDLKVVDSKIFGSPYGTGVAILTSANTIWIVNNVKDVRAKKLPEVPGVNNGPSAWVVVCEERSSRVLFARDKDIFCLREGESLASFLRINLGDDSYVIKDMAVSSNYEKLSILTSRGKLWIGNVDGTECYRTYDSRFSSPQHYQLLWCGTDAVVINWGQTLDVVGLTDENISYSYEDSVFCVQEIDCIRTISHHTMEIIQKVPQEVRDIFQINSTSPGAYLLEASKQFLKKSHRANEYLHLVKPKLYVAVMQCIEAAGHQFDVGTQKMLMKAAQFGKICLDDCSPENYVTMIRLLRCLNTVRHPRIGLPLTITQLKSLTMQGLMELLMIRRHHFLALDLTTFLKMPNSSRIQLHWACYKVQHSKDSDVNVIARDIADKIGNSKDVSYRDIAMKAFQCGKRELAIKLIEYEPQADLQIPLLLKLKEHFLALNKAIDSGNTDLVYHVLDQMGKNIGEAEFQMAIRNYPLAQSLYLKHCALHNKDLLKNVYTQEDDHKRLAELSIKECLDPKNSSTREASLVAAQESFKRAKLEVNAQICDEQMKLNKHQKNLVEKLNADFHGLSLHETVKKLLTLNEVKLADKLRGEYKVPDRRYWWLRVQVLVDREDFTELEKFSKIKKSPIGYEPFVDVCLKRGFKREAQKYLPKVRDDLKVQYYAKAGMMEEAARLAFEKKDLESLEFLLPKCDPVLSETIDNYLKLSKK